MSELQKQSEISHEKKMKRHGRMSFVERSKYAILSLLLEVRTMLTLGAAAAGTIYQYTIF